MEVYATLCGIQGSLLFGLPWRLSSASSGRCADAAAKSAQYANRLAELIERSEFTHTFETHKDPTGETMTHFYELNSVPRTDYTQTLEVVPTLLRNCESR